MQLTVRNVQTPKIGCLLSKINCILLMSRPFNENVFMTDIMLLDRKKNTPDWTLFTFANYLFCVPVTIISIIYDNPKRNRIVRLSKNKFHIGFVKKFICFFFNFDSINFKVVFIWKPLKICQNWLSPISPRMRFEFRCQVV